MASDLFQPDQPTAPPSAQPKGMGRERSLPLRTGVSYPHNGYKARLRDPRLREYLLRLNEARTNDDPEGLLWVLCAGVWWLERPQTVELADVLKAMLEDNPP
jgi:hypothetical protein